MTHIAGFERDQLLLLPEAVDDYVDADNPVRFIDAFVDGLDLTAAGFLRVEAKATGRPGYAPCDLLKLYIYGYLNRVRSSRRLEREAHRNIEVIWLLRGLRPDFKTIADFRRDNAKAFRAVFRQFVLLCRRLDLYGRELLAVDGTRIKAVNNKDRNFTRSSLREFIRAADKRLDDYLARLDASDIEDGATTGGARTKNLAEKIEALRKKRGRYEAVLAQLDRTYSAFSSIRLARDAGSASWKRSNDPEPNRGRPRPIPPRPRTATQFKATSPREARARAE
jgi:transposase